LHGRADLARLIAENKCRKIQGGKLEIAEKQAAGDAEYHGFGDGETGMVELCRYGTGLTMRCHFMVKGAHFLNS
jgi:hypothetical protein